MNKHNPTGFFGPYGGQFIPETLIPIFNEIADCYTELKNTASFRDELAYYYTHYVGRPSPIYFAERLSRTVSGNVDFYLKREDLNHTGAHKINHTIGEVLVAKKMNKRRVIAETGAGQHGVALATACALLDMPCEIFMGAIDMDKQPTNVLRIEMLGAKIHRVEHGTKTLKDAVDAAFEAFITDPQNIFFGIGSVVGPHPFPTMIRDFQSIVGKEAEEQFRHLTGQHPDMVTACVGGGSNAIGLFSGFIDIETVSLVGVEPAGKGLETKQHAATLTKGSPGTIHGMHTYVLEDETNVPSEVYSIASGLDYPGVGPEHSFLKDTSRVLYETVTDEECLNAFKLLNKTEGIIPALESAHAVAFALRYAKTAQIPLRILINLSGRGDKDIEFVSSIESTLN